MLSEQNLVKLQCCILSTPYTQKTLANGALPVFAKIEGETKRLKAVLRSGGALAPSQDFSSPQRELTPKRRLSPSSKADARL